MRMPWTVAVAWLGKYQTLRPMLGDMVWLMVAPVVMGRGGTGDVKAPLQRG